MEEFQYDKLKNEVILNISTFFFGHVKGKLDESIILGEIFINIYNFYKLRGDVKIRTYINKFDKKNFEPMDL